MQLRIINGKLLNIFSFLVVFSVFMLKFAADKGDSLSNN
jgi:hypothetical protein